MEFSCPIYKYSWFCKFQFNTDWLIHLIIAWKIKIRFNETIYLDIKVMDNNKYIIRRYGTYSILICSMAICSSSICSIAHRSRRLLYMTSALYVICSMIKNVICSINIIYDCLGPFALFNFCSMSKHVIAL